MVTSKQKLGLSELSESMIANSPEKDHSIVIRSMDGMTFCNKNSEKTRPSQACNLEEDEIDEYFHEGANSNLFGKHNPQVSFQKVHKSTPK
jgi:hypothetical protein